MKLTSILLVALSILTFTTLSGFQLGDVAKGAKSITGGASSSELIAKGSSLMKAFQGNEKAVAAAKGLMNSFKAEDYLKGFQYYDKIQAAGLTAAQLKTWNETKNAISAIILKSNFDLSEKGLADLVNKASSALQSNGISKATKYLVQIKDAAQLSKGQKSLISAIIAHTPLAK